MRSCALAGWGRGGKRGWDWHFDGMSMALDGLEKGRPASPMGNVRVVCFELLGCFVQEVSPSFLT